VQSLHQVTGQCFHRSSDPVSFYLRSGGLVKRVDALGKCGEKGGEVSDRSILLVGG